MSRLSREIIARAAIEIADADGVDAVSMRRVATHLGVGTMSLYHHVRDKRALFSFMADAIMAEQLIPADEVPESWREGLAEIARRARVLFSSHGWVLESWHETDRADPGPSFAAHIEQTLAIVAELDFLSVAERLQITGLVDEYVVGNVMHSASEAEPSDRWEAYAAEQARTGAYPHLAEAFASGLGDAEHDSFAFGLERLLDGIELYVERAEPAASRRSRSAASSSGDGSH